MNDPLPNPNQSQLVRKPIYKFLIGFTGALCAAIFPRLMAALALHDSASIQLMSMGYLGLAILFALLVGGVVMIMEWGVLKEPRATFMTALGLPALLSGALNTSNGAYVLDSKAKENAELADVVQSLSNIQEFSIEGFTPLSDATESVYQFSPLALIGIGDAQAELLAQAPQQQLDFNPSIKFQQKNYFIVLDTATSESDAKSKAADMKTQVPNAQAVRAGDQYLIIIPEAKSKSEAVLNSVKLKQKGLNPSLLEKK